MIEQIKDLYYRHFICEYTAYEEDVDEPEEENCEVEFWLEDRDGEDLLCLHSGEEYTIIKNDDYCYISANIEDSDGNYHEKSSSFDILEDEEEQLYEIANCACYFFATIGFEVDEVGNIIEK